MANIKAHINYDAIPCEGYKHQVEITIDDEVDSYVSVMDDSSETVQKVLNEFSIEYNNRLIAEYMELEYEDGLYYYTTLMDDYKTTTLYFDSSWDWLMPVVEKCFDRLMENDNWDYLNFCLNDALLTTNIDEVYKAVIKIIKHTKGAMD